MKSYDHQSPRLSYKFFFFSIFLVGSFSTGLKAQQYQPVGKRITFAGKNVRLADFFNVVWDQTRMQAFYNDEQLSSNERITVNFKREPLDNVLAFLLRKKKLTWYYREETFVILPKKPGDPDLGEMPDEAHIDVPGQVTDKNGVPLQNASVIVKGSRKGAYTNETGKFLINHIRKKTVLAISCIGYSPKTIQVFDDDTLKVQLSPAVTGLDEVLIIAYGTSTRRDLTGAVSRITSKDIAQQPVTDPLLALQGRVPGLNITQSSGLPGSYTKVELRGRKSIAAGNSPLYIVDGVPFPGTSLSLDNILEDGIAISPLAGSNPLNMINVADIASIDVLKDADATAIYGSRGANGVILITTKSAKRQKMTLDANIYTGMGKMAHGVQYMNTQQYLQMRREAFKNDHADPGVFDYDVNGAWDTTRYTNWQKVLLGGTAHLTDAQVAFAGGDSIVQARISAGYHRESTVYPSDFNYQKASARVNLQMNSPNNRGRIVLNTSYVADRNYLPSIDMTTYAITSPNTPEIYTPDGKLNWERSTFLNPMANLLKVYKANTSNLMTNAILSYWILDGLQIKTSVGYNFMQVHELQPNPTRAYNPAFNQVGNTKFADGTSKSWIIEPQLTYDHEIWNGRLEALLGATLQQETRKQEGIWAYGYTNDALIENRTAASTFYSLGNSYYQYRYNALFGRLKYNWKGKYILNLTARRDGSSRFGPGRQMANFGSVGAAWIFSNEPWISQTLPFLSFGKLRGSYGRTGNDQIADYGYYATYSFSSPYQGYAGLLPTRLYNANYGWELSNKAEVGLELGFRNDQLLLRASYYNNRSSKQLVNAPISGLSGFNTIVDNYPALVENTGWEFELNTQNIKSPHFTWSTSFNISIPRNKLLAFPNIGNTPYNWFYTVGQSLNVYKGFHYTGVNGDGFYGFADVDGNDKLVAFSPDYAFTKPLGPFYYGGLQNSFSYKGLQLDVFFQFVKQNRYSYLYTGPVPGANRNQPVAVGGRWQQKGDNKRVQQYTQALTDAYQSYSNMQQSDGAIEDASYIRLKNVSFSYQLPGSWMRSAHLRSVRCYLQGQNLLTFTNYKGRDPEVASQYDVYPPLRVWTFGIQFGL
jgi:TonB-linked SusC/RagA family outer membrane protein